MSERTKYTATLKVEVVQFLAPTREQVKDFKYPDGMKPWPDDFGNQPKDMSWGYVKDGPNKLHVMHGDWIVFWPYGKVEVLSYLEFKERGYYPSSL